jgi:hypothetical protein
VILINPHHLRLKNIDNPPEKASDAFFLEYNLIKYSDDLSFDKYMAFIY